MNPTNIEHIGIAVSDLESSIRLYEKVFGLKCYKIEEIPEQRVRAAFFRIGQIKIELLEPAGQDGPIGKFIGCKGEGIHHIAFTVSNIEEKLKSAKNDGIMLIDDFPRKGADGLDIAFLHPKSTGGVLIELCEDKQLFTNDTQMK